MKNSEAVAITFNSLKFLNKDDRISRRFVLRLMQSISATFISQRLFERTLQNDLKIYSELRCLEMEKVESIKCPIVEFRTCNTLMRSKKPLPELVFSRLGASIKDITSVDNLFEFRLLDLQQYRRNKKRKYQLKEVLAYLGIDNHLYIPEEEVYAINANLITMKTDEVDDCSECKKSNCKSGWEYEFICPDRLLDAVIKETLKIIASTTRAIVEDPNPNNLDGR